jgi:hypothetical protein
MREKYYWLVADKPNEQGAGRPPCPRVGERRGIGMTLIDGVHVKKRPELISPLELRCILVPLFFAAGLQIGFEALNLQTTAGVALRQTKIIIYG